MTVLFFKTAFFKKTQFIHYLFSIIFSGLLGLLISSNPALADNSRANKIIRLATTTSTENSGLLKYLLPHFEKDSAYKVHTIAVGTGKALRMGQDGDVDVLLVHAPKAENDFIAKGHGEQRYPVMYNDFVIVGPKNDPAGISKATTITEALKKIASTKSRFISRGDDSGTHKKERTLWKLANISPDNKHAWYLQAGQGMGKVLQIADEMGAYTMTDRGTWLAYQNKLALRIVFQGDTTLFNPYGIIAVSRKKYPDLNTQGAKALINWITSDKGQNLIGKFKVAGKTLFTPNASSIALAAKAGHKK